MRQVGVRELRSVIDDVERGEAIELTRGGKPVARIFPANPPVSPEFGRPSAHGARRPPRSPSTHSQATVWPPSTGRMMPVRKRDSSEAR